MLQQPALWMSLTIFSVQLLFACATRSAWCASSTAWAERSWHRQESCCEPIRDGRCQRHETNETHQSRKKLGIIRHPNWCKMFIFRNWKPHPLRCSQNTCACLVQKGLQLGDALLTRATSNSGEQKSLVWQSQTAKIIWDQPSFLQFLELLCCRPVVILHLQHTCCAGRRQVIHAQPSAQRTRGTWRLACSSASSAFCLVSQPQNIGEK